MKRNFQCRNKRATKLDDSLLNKLRNADSLLNSLSAGSKNRLNQYRKNLSISRGDSDESVEFDKNLRDLLKGYVYNSADFAHQERYLNHLRDEEGFRFSRNLKIYSKISDDMERFSLPDHTSFRWNENYRKSLEEFKLEFSKLKLHPISFTCDDDVKEFLPKLDTHSGYYWILSGKKKKGDNIEGIFNVFISECDNALDVGSFNKPILIGFRTQASGEYDDNGTITNHCKHKLRVVSMIDLVQIICELMFSNPIQNYLGGMSYYAGGKNESTIGGYITNWRIKFNKFLSIDYSSFDQTISSWLIEDAFSIIKAAFVMDEKQSNLFDIIVNDFIHKDFVLNEGLLHSDRGVPSGSMFTQIIDSLVNLLVIKTYFNSINAKADMMCMGDDNVIFTNANISINDLASYTMKNFGLIVKTDDKSNEGNTKKNEVKFLSRFWRFDGQYRHPHQLISRMLYPERHRNYTNEIGPEHVIFAFILTYKLGMEQLMDVRKFMHDYPISREYVMNNVDSRYLPGALAYIREYT
jgi:hypothetical protein